VNVDLARRLIIERNKRRKPLPQTDAERAYLALTQWQSTDQFRVYAEGEPVPVGDPALDPEHFPLPEQ
jgi:hypothetical protein